MKAKISEPRPCNGPTCKQMIRFVTTVGKKGMPVDAGLIQSTKVETLVLEDGMVKKDAEIGTVGYRPHWATCPDRDRFRKKKVANEHP